MLVWSSFQNIDALTAIAGADASEGLRERARLELTRVGPTFCAGPDDFVTITQGEVSDTSDRLRAMSWLVHALLGVTEAWSMRSDGKELEGLVPRRLLELTCGLRFGVVALDSKSADLETSAERAMQQCEEQKRDRRGITRFGFPALWPERFRTLTQIADPSCPACAARPAIIEERSDDSTIERCTHCDLEYERHLVLLVGGRRVGARHT